MRDRKFIIFDSHGLNLHQIKYSSLDEGIPVIAIFNDQTKFEKYIKIMDKQAKKYKVYGIINNME